MKAVTTSVARQHLPELLETVAQSKERILIERHGRPIALLSALESLEASADQAGTEWNELAAALPALNARLDRLIATVQTVQRRNRAFRKEMTRLHSQRKQLLWRS
jgi:PHD/YefM family antitoxin component YafN of YafNO toxin-antitoxin module